MRHLNLKLYLIILLLSSLTIWVFVLLISGTEFKLTWNALSKLSHVITVQSILAVIFIKWLWKLPILQGWLVPFPDLNGTWKGKVEPTWVSPKTAKGLAPLTAYLVIKQSFVWVSCKLYTKEASSQSYSSQFILSKENNQKKLIFSYTSKPNVKVRHRSVVHDGTVVLDIISRPTRFLRGEYWTNRKTTGDIELKFSSKKLIEKFPLT